VSLRQFRDWIRVVIAPDWILWGALTSVFCLWVVELILRLALPSMARLSAPSLTDSELYLPEIPPIHGAAVLLAALLYGTYRGVAFHPLGNRRYGVWLAQTPWKFSMPMPLGPIQLVWQDVAAIVALMCLAWLPPQELNAALYVPAAFLFAYCAMHIATFHQLGAYRDVVVATVVFAGAILVGRSPVALLALAAVLYRFTYTEIRRSMHDFPFTSKRREELGLVPYIINRPLEIGLPILPSLYVESGYGPLYFVNRYALFVGAVAGILFFSSAFHFRNEKDFEVGLRYVFRLISLLLIVARTLSYLVGHLPPISIAGRVVTRQWILPGYDKMLVAPLVALFATFALPQVLLLFGLPTIVAFPLSLAATVWLCFGIRPTIVEWHYTGHFRIPNESPGKRQQFVRA
jgi:hypothetical protein